MLCQSSKIAKAFSRGESFGSSCVKFVAMLGAVGAVGAVGAEVLVRSSLLRGEFLLDAGVYAGVSAKSCLSGDLLLGAAVSLAPPSLGGGLLPGVGK